MLLTTSVCRDCKVAHPAPLGPGVMRLKATKKYIVEQYLKVRPDHRSNFEKWHCPLLPLSSIPWCCSWEWLSCNFSLFGLVVVFPIDSNLHFNPA